MDTMFDFLYVTCIFFIVSNIKIVVEAINYDKENFVSEYSGELPDLNEVIDSASKEYYSYEPTTEHVLNTNATQYTDVNVHNTTTTPIENITSNYFNCEDKKTSSSEENRCKSTLVNYPYSASIQKKGAHYASGALINDQTVLTAAGVFYHVRETIKFFRVRLGSVDCKKGGVSIPIKLMEIHPSFKKGKPAFDVAIISLAQPVQFSDYIKPIPLSTVKQRVISAKFLTTYWPRLIVNGTVLPTSAKERLKHQSMRVSTQKLIPWKTCADLMRARDAVLDETSLCLKPIETHHSSCMPDVGAPVVAEDGLWGITSGWTSAHCSTYPSPTIITRTAMPPVRSWLESVLTKTGAFRGISRREPGVSLRDMLDRSTQVDVSVF